MQQSPSLARRIAQLLAIALAAIGIYRGYGYLRTLPFHITMDAGQAALAGITVFLISWFLCKLWWTLVRSDAAATREFTTSNKPAVIDLGILIVLIIGAAFIAFSN